MSTTPEVAELRTERLLLRDWRDSDLEPFAQPGHPLRPQVVYRLANPDESVTT